MRMGTLRVLGIKALVASILLLSSLGMVVFQGYTGNGERQRFALLTRSLREVALRDFSWLLLLGRMGNGNSASCLQELLLQFLCLVRTRCLTRIVSVVRKIARWRFYDARG